MVAAHNPVAQALAPGPAALVAARDNQIVQAARQVVADALHVTTKLSKLHVKSLRMCAALAALNNH